MAFVALDTLTLSTFVFFNTLKTLADNLILEKTSSKLFKSFKTLSKNSPVKIKTIYENTIKGVGALASAFAEEKTIILFGDSAPDTLKDYCYSIDVKKADAVIEPGHMLEIDGKTYKILVVGDVMQKNLEALGHISIQFSGAGDGLPGTMVVEEAEVPVMDTGSTVRILA